MTTENTERTAPTGETGREIEAQLHEDALKQSSALRNANLRQALDEVLQNARRAGATLVRIDNVEDGGIRITDNGWGITDPQLVLSFGESNWDGPTTPREHAAGVGLYALARWNPTIRSRRAERPDQAWSVTLSEAHFRNGAKATVLPDDGGAPQPHGTEVTIRRAETERMTASAAATRLTNEQIKDATRHFPVRVLLDGEEVEKANYLKNWAWRHTSKGLRIGVGTEVWRIQQTGELNFHGKQINDAGLPRVMDIDGRLWGAQIDVREAPELELTLPPDSTIVDGPFATRMREEAERAIYLGMTEAGQHVKHQVRQRAAALGVNMPEPPQKLRVWQPERPNGQQPNRSEPTPIDSSCLIVDAEIMASDSQMLSYAAAGTPLAERLREGEPSHAGYHWYDSLGRVEAMRIEARDSEQVYVRETNEDPRSAAPPAQCDDIILVLTIRRASGKTTTKIPANIAFWDTDEDDVNVREIRATVRRHVTIQREVLRELLTNAFFWASDEHGADSYMTQRDRFTRDADIRAGDLLDCRREAAQSVIEELVRQHILPEIRQNQKATIRMEGASGQVVVEIDDQPAGAE